MKEYQAMAMAYDIQSEEEFMGDDWLDSFAAMTILDAKYEKVDVQEVATCSKAFTRIPAKSVWKRC